MEATEKAYFCYKYIMFDMDACLLSAQRGWAGCTGTSWHQDSPRQRWYLESWRWVGALKRQVWRYWVGLVVLGRTGCAGTAALWLLLEKAAVTYSPLSSQQLL